LRSKVFKKLSIEKKKPEEVIRVDPLKHNQNLLNLIQEIDLQFKQIEKKFDE
jgi:hypothetical protein